MLRNLGGRGWADESDFVLKLKCFCAESLVFGSPLTMNAGFCCARFELNFNSHQLKYNTFETAMRSKLPMFGQVHQLSLDPPDFTADPIYQLRNPLASARSKRLSKQ